MLLPLPAPAQDLTVKAPPQQRPILLVGAAIHPVSDDVIEDGYIGFAEGRITTIGAGEPAPNLINEQTIVIDAAGSHVYPGLIGANTLMGLVEINAVRATRDFREVNSISPEVMAITAVNPDSTIIPVTRSNGILTCGIMPYGGAIPGRASVIRMDGWTNEDMALAADAGLVVNWPSLRVRDGWWVTKSADEQREEMRRELNEIDEAFAQARAYIAAKQENPLLPTDIRWEAMRAALAGDKPVFIRANELEQIHSVIAWAERQDIRAVIVGGQDADLAADALKRHDIAVMVTGTHRMPRRRDAAYDEAFTLPQRLEEAGVAWCLASSGGSFDTPHERNLPYHAATAVAYGLDPEVAIRSITLSAAEILGVGGEIGSLEEGKAATLIVTTGNPLEVTTDVELAFIDGRAIDLSNKQIKLKEKYRTKYRQLGLLPAGGDEEVEEERVGGADAREDGRLAR